MAFNIDNRCINCDACEYECPNEAIYLAPDHCQIDPERCTECVGHYEKPQCIKVCPVTCIVPHLDYRESREQLLAKCRALGGRG